MVLNQHSPGMDFFHLDALSSSVALKVDFDVVLTEIATGFCRLMARQLTGYETAEARQIYRHFLDTPSQIEIGEHRVEVQLPKRAHDPLLIAAGVAQKEVTISWWDNYHLAITFA